MAAVLTVQNSINTLKNTIEDIGSLANNYYLFVGKPSPWPDDTNPPVANQSYKEMVSVYSDLVYGKLITSQNISPLINNYQWSNGTIYAQYDVNDDNLFNENFYVITPSMNVYKCVDNNGNTQSTFIPNLTPLSGCFQTADGYTWKYMFNIPTSSNNFVTPNYIPVVANTTIESYAVPGTIDVYRILNSGNNYQGYHEGIIQSVLSPDTIQVAANAVGVDAFYNGCSLYLKSGLGSGQISQIVNYSGSNKIVTVNPPFNVYVTLQLSNIQGNIYLGDIIIQQVEEVNFLYEQGYFNVGDIVLQSDSGISGTVGTANQSLFSLYAISSNTMIGVGANAYPLYNTRNTGSLLTGNVSVTLGSNVISTNFTGGANLQTLSVGNYIRVGTNANTNIRRITQITSATSAKVSLPFKNTVNAVAYLVPDAVEPTSTTIVEANGVVNQLNLTSVILSFSNSSTSGLGYVLGETVKEFSNTGVDQLCNGVVSFANNNTLIISGVNGTFGTGNNIVGQQSNLTSYINNITTYPNITMNNVEGNFHVGFPIISFNTNHTALGNATPMSILTVPSTQVEYIISPTVTIDGDGSNAVAYAVVNNAPGTFWEITDIVPINVGISYTNANVIITSANSYGTGANIEAIISPLSGHGADPISELGARNLGVSMTFDTATNEVYKFPNYGTYRRAGIIKNPAFNQVVIGTGTSTRNNLSITSATGNFTNNEIAIQVSTGFTAGKIQFSNSSTVQVASLNGQGFATGNTILGLNSNTSATITAVNTLPFTVTANIQPLYDQNSNSVIGNLSQVINANAIMVTNLVGTIQIGDTIYDPSVNSYNTISTIYPSNTLINIANNYGLRFNQGSRITLSANIGTFTVGEQVNQQISGASGYVLDTTHELDLTYIPNTGTISTGVVLTDSKSGANGVVIFANSSYIRLTGINGHFSNTDIITTITGNGTISSIYPVIIVTDVGPFFDTGAQYTINGANSGAMGLCTILDGITLPDLSTETGEVLYVNNLRPFSKTLTSKEQFSVVIGY